MKISFFLIFLIFIPLASAYQLQNLDFNQNTIIDINDLKTLTGNMGNFNIQYDLNSDSKINLQDITIISANIGKCYDECTAGICQTSNSFRACGSFDSDTCKDYGPETACPQSQTCSQGNCAAQYTGEIRYLHIMADLKSYGCDMWDTRSVKCRWESFNRCRELGFVAGFGPTDYHESVAWAACLNDVAVYQEYSYSGDCKVDNPSSLWCQSASRRNCIASGYKSSTGVIGANPSKFGTLCLKDNINVAEIASTLTELSATKITAANMFSPPYTGCAASDIVGGYGCQQHVNALCIKKGYDAGFSVTEYNGGNGDLSITCIKNMLKRTDPQGYKRFPGMDAYARPLTISKNIVGGPSYAGQLTYGDAIYNNFDYPVMVRTEESYTTFTAANANAYSRDSCLALNRGGTWQYDDNDDGELACTYSDSKENPATNFKDRGILLNPGEKIIYQATPQWNSPDTGEYAWAEINITRVLPNTFPVRRIRFPKWDTGYWATGGTTFTIAAGCDYPDCAPGTPTPHVDTSKPSQNSNWWFTTSSATTIRGISVFMSNGQSPGTQKVSACIKINNQGTVTSPYCFEVAGDYFTPDLYTQVFGESKSNFKPLDIPVPAGAKIGMDYTFYTQTDCGLDFVGFVWVDAK